LARFQREAKFLAALNHPNIASIYGVEVSGNIRALIMELVEGPTLADRIKAGPIPIDDAVPFAKRICEALEYAHERGVVHRDLKPANIKVSGEESIKILDFGLAKAVRGEAQATSPGDSPTLSKMATRAGVLLGTAAYMSPEQAKGKPVDRRADIWAFGCVLYEMLTGKKAFAGEGVTETLAAVLKNEPDWSLLPSATPIHVRVLLQRCLQKDPKQRLRDIGDARISLDEVLSGAAAAALNAALPTPVWRRAVPWGLFAVMVVLAAYLYWGDRPPATQPVRFEIASPALTTYTLSPDGQRLAALGPGPNGRQGVWIRALDSLEPQFLAGTEDVNTPVFWSFDSRFIVFQTGTRLEKIDVSGGPPLPICDITDSVLGGSWNRDGTIILGTIATGIMRVPAAGGTPTRVTSVSGSNDIHVFPSFLPDGRHFIYLRAPEDSGIYVGSLEVKPEQQSSERVLATPVSAAYVPTEQRGMGRLLFVREGRVLAQPFDERRLALTGEPVLLAPRVATFLLSGNFSASSNGALAYERSESGPGLSQLTWFDRKGKELGTAGEPGYHYFDLALSPDAAWVATTRTSLTSAGEAEYMWLLDLVRGVSVRFNLDAAPETWPVWSPNGTRIAFTAYRAGGSGIYQKASNGASSEQALVPSSADLKMPDDWSRDGRFLLYAKQDPTTNADLWVLPLATDGTPGGAPAPFADTKFNEDQGQFSPDTN
jgi:Tol biopolymer transport system component